MQAIRNLQFAVLQRASPTTPYKAGRVVKLTCQYDTDFQGVRISHATLESIHLKEKMKIFTISVFCFNMRNYPISKICFFILEMLSLHYILHASCPVLVLRIVLQVEQKTFLMLFQSWFISLIPESWYITNICMEPLMLMVNDGIDTIKNGATYFTTS